MDIIKHLLANGKGLHSDSRGMLREFGLHCTHQKRRKNGHYSSSVQNRLSEEDNPTESRRKKPNSSRHQQVAKKSARRSPSQELVPHKGRVRNATSGKVNQVRERRSNKHLKLATTPSDTAVI